MGALIYILYLQDSINSNQLVRMNEMHTVEDTVSNASYLLTTSFNKEVSLVMGFLYADFDLNETNEELEKQEENL